MAFRALVSIAGHDILDPSTYSAITSTVVDSGRNVKGYFVGSVIRDDMAKIEMGWNFISTKNWADLLSLFSQNRGGSFVNSVTFFCQDTGDWQTRQMYINDRKANVFKRDTSGAIIGYTGAALALIEV